MLDNKTMDMLEKLKSQYPNAAGSIDQVITEISGEGEEDFMEEPMPEEAPAEEAPMVDDEFDF